MPTKELFIVAGPNGAGKSTFAAEFLVECPCYYLSADLIAGEMTPENPASMRFAAGREFSRRLGNCLAVDADFLVETTLSGRTFRRVLDKAKPEGFTTTIIFIYLDSAETCVARVRERVRKGGHDVPQHEIRRRFSRSFANFWNVYRQVADLWYVVYNSSSEFADVAFGNQDDISVTNESLFATFLQLTETA